MKNEFVVQISYEKLREIIVNYFEKVEGLNLSYPSIDYLKDILRESHKYNESRYFSIKNDLGCSKVDIPKSDIFKILSLYLVEKSYGLLGIKYDDKIEVTYKFLKVAENSLLSDETSENIKVKTK